MKFQKDMEKLRKQKDSEIASILAEKDAVISKERSKVVKVLTALQEAEVKKQEVEGQSNRTNFQVYYNQVLVSKSLTSIVHFCDTQPSEENPLGKKKTPSKQAEATRSKRGESSTRASP